MQVQRQLSGKTAVITGSTSGIGLGIAHEFAKAGADVVINGLGSADEHQDIIAELAKHGTKVMFGDANMMKSGEIVAMLNKVEAETGGIDILVNNAGIQHVSPIEDFPPEKWDAILAINLTSSFHTIRTVVPGMKARKWGRIINICSAHSLRASAHKAAYVAAKHGLAGLTKVVALECATAGITVQRNLAGLRVDTVWSKAQLPDIAKADGISIEEAKAQVLKRQPSGEFATVDQIGALATFLASEPAAAITGANYSIDGGWTAQ